MPKEYEDLVKALQESGIPFVEYAWKTSPEGNYGVISLEFEADHLDADDGKRFRAWEGSVDVYFRKLADRAEITETVEGILETYCAASWRVESYQYESATGLFHKEWVFQVEE